MSFLVPTLHAVLHKADEQLTVGRVVRARQAYEALLEQAQDRADRGMEVAARSMRARCLLRLGDLDGCRDGLRQAALLLDPVHLESHGRYRGTLARLAVEEGPAEVTQRELTAYLAWAEGAQRGTDILDACLLLGHISPPDPRVVWLQRGIEQAIALGVVGPLGHAYNALGAAMDQLDRAESALEAYQASLSWHQRADAGRHVVSAGWAVGASACGLEEWPLARTALEDALALADEREDCDDLVALALADLATVYEAAGDVVEARRIIIRALRSGRDQQLGTLWPERWGAIVAYGRRLEVE